MGQNVRERGSVVSPDGVEIMRQGKNAVMVGADQQTLLPLAQPLLVWQLSALWATAMTTRVVSDLVEVPIWTTVDVSTHCSGSAVHYLKCRTAHVI